MTIEIRFLDEIEATTISPSILLYGGSGVGKTFTLGTGGDRAVIIDCGVGPLETLRSKTFRTKHPDARPRIIRLRETFDPDGVPAGEAFDRLGDIIDYVLKELAGEIDFLCIDNATAVRNFAMAKGLYVSKEQKRSFTLDKVKGTGGLVVPAVQDYGMEMNLMEWFIGRHIDDCKEANVCFVLTAHVRETFRKVKDSKGKPIIGEAPNLVSTRPGFTGQTFPDDIPALFDEVWYAERVGGGETATSRIRPYGEEDHESYGKLVAKTTFGSGVLNSVEIDPSLPKLLDRMRRSATKKE